MALFTPSESPAVVVREIDLTGGVPNVQSTTGAFVGNFRWGPVRERRLISNETELVSTFGGPDDDNAVDFLSATQFLRYSSTLQVIRNVIDSGDNQAWNAVALTNIDSLGATTGDGIENQLILNVADFTARQSSIATLSDEDILNDSGVVTDAGSGAKIHFAAKYPGSLGNSLRVSYITAIDSADTTSFSNWPYAASFDAAPSTSVTATARGALHDEMHMIVVDEDGTISGAKGTILETYPNLSILSDAKNSEGQSVYAKEIVNNVSQYIYLVNFDSDLTVVGAGSPTVLNKDYYIDNTGANVKFTTGDSAKASIDRSFTNGANSADLGVSEYLEGFDEFEDKDQVEVDFLIAPGMNALVDQTTVINDLVATAQQARKDCVVVASPHRNGLVNVSADADKVANTLALAKTLTKSSYLVVDNNYLKVYDKYNDKYVEIPASSTVAGIMAATDFNRAAWFSPAGARRGQLLGITALNYSASKAQRDSLYKVGVNPIANIPGQGALLFGDKTFLGRPSAFDRINVRRLFLILERAIARAAEQVLFEFNDEFTRAEFVNIVEPVLREIQGRRGITDFRVVADETNNTAEVIDRNEFKADIFIKPARSINYVTLSFVAVRTGVDFEEVVGTV